MGTPYRVYLGSMLSKFPPNVLAEPALSLLLGDFCGVIWSNPRLQEFYDGGDYSFSDSCPPNYDAAGANLQFVTSPPKIDRKKQSYDWHYHAELIDKPESFTSIACERSTDGLNIKIVTRVSYSCHPETPRFQTKPSVNKRIAYNHNRKTNQSEPERLSGTGIIVTPDQQGIVPQGPHRAA
jgi:hypothetical protein